MRPDWPIIANLAQTISIFPIFQLYVCLCVCARARTCVRAYACVHCSQGPFVLEYFFSVLGTSMVRSKGVQIFRINAVIAPICRSTEQELINKF